VCRFGQCPHHSILWRTLKESIVGTPHPDADDVSLMLSKVRSANSVLNCVNKVGPVGSKSVKKAIAGKFPENLDTISDIISSKIDAEAEILRLKERVSILTTIAPLNIPLELMTGISSVDVYLGETRRRVRLSQYLVNSKTV
jgi:hypothetical protein